MTAAAAPRSGRRAPTVQQLFFLLAAITVAAIGAAAVQIVRATMHGQAASNQLTDSVLPAQAQAYRMQSALADQQAAVRGYALTDDTRWLTPFPSDRATELTSAANLRHLIAGQPQLVGTLDQIERTARAWQVGYAVPLMALAAHGPLTGPELSEFGRGRPSLRQIPSLFRQQQTGLDQLQARDRTRLASTRVATYWLYSAMLAGVGIGAGVGALLLRRAVVRPLRRLRVSTQDVAAGNFERNIPMVGPADVRAVAADIEAMRRGLAAALADARAAEKAAARQATDLDVYSRQLARSNSELEQFAYVASHDLQEPLRKIASFCQLLDQRYAEYLDERGRQYIWFAVDGAKRMQRLINDLLALSRVGRADAPRLRVSMDEALDLALTALASAIEESGARIKRPDALPTVTGDLTLLALVWQNLISNSIKFSGRGEVPEIKLDASPLPGNKWLMSIADQGMSVPPEFADRIFVIFQRLHNREEYTGTGIGLALCQRIVAHHGGDIGLDTSYAGGTRIYFTLPQ